MSGFIKPCHCIEETEEDHYIIIDKCRRNPEALAYFLKHASISNTFVSFVGTSNKDIQEINSFSEKVKALDHCTDITDETHINLSTGEAVTVYLDSATEQDDRVMCSDCANLNWRGFCNQWEVTNPGNSKYSPVQDVKGRCNSFLQLCNIANTLRGKMNADEFYFLQIPIRKNWTNTDS